jgi:hypothetical protein
VNARRIVAGLLVALGAYVAIIGYRGVFLLTQHGAALKVLGAAVLVIPLVGVWVVVLELRFGRATQRLAVALDEDPPELPHTRQGGWTVPRPTLCSAGAGWPSRPIRTTGVVGTGWRSRTTWRVTGGGPGLRCAPLSNTPRFDPDARCFGSTKRGATFRV